MKAFRNLLGCDYERRMCWSGLFDMPQLLILGRKPRLHLPRTQQPRFWITHNNYHCMTRHWRYYPQLLDTGQTILDSVSLQDLRKHGCATAIDSILTFIQIRPLKYPKLHIWGILPHLIYVCMYSLMNGTNRWPLDGRFQPHIKIYYLLRTMLTRTKRLKRDGTGKYWFYYQW